MYYIQTQNIKLTNSNLIAQPGLMLLTTEDDLFNQYNAIINNETIPNLIIVTKEFEDLIKNQDITIDLNNYNTTEQQIELYLRLKKQK